MIYSKRFFLLFALLYTAGFLILELFFGSLGVSEGKITTIAVIHNFVSTIICAYYFYMREGSRAKWLWVALGVFYPL